MYSPRQFDPTIEKSIKQDKGIHPLLARLLSQRKIGVSDLNFSDDSFLHLENLKLIKNIRSVSNLLMDMKRNGQSASIISDYDADGIISSYMIKRLCEILGIECSVFLPSRFEHGYGLNAQTLGSFLAFTITNKSPDVLFILDCGSSSEKEIKELKLHHNINAIVVIDHHIIKEDSFSKSAHIVTNWRLNNNAQEMCTCGLAYIIALDMFLTHGCLTQDNMKELLSLAAIGTIADVSTIIGDNRVIVKQGLGFFNKLSSDGLSDLVKLCKLQNSTITQQQIGFRLAPRLNAVGRLGSPQKAFDLLVSKDKDEIEDILKSLEETNQQRQQIQGDILNEAIKMVDEKLMPYGILLINPKWNIGVVGIVASEIVEKFNKPTVIIGRDKGVFKGSGRSIKGVNLKKILDSCSEMFERYGGHEMAAGVSIKPEFKDKAPMLFNSACKDAFDVLNKGVGKINYYDAKLNPKTVSIDTWGIINSLYPFCEANNPEPVFLLENMLVKEYRKKETEKWKLSTLSFEGLDFKFISFLENLDEGIKGKNINVYFKFPQIIDPKWGMSLEIVDVENV